ncbi:FixH family protein [Microvirga flavescens]|uniref:FixH family protein n=1 Tax=Microvirga flavescens TaxID=2249811 RepID=UPI000DD6A1AE|nr:FixH family protein [Microvirga flavescens]
MPTTLAPKRAPRPLTGRMVLACLFAFFGTVFAMNAVMVRVATSTFGGVETESSYKAGLTFKKDVAIAEAQDALHWKVEANLRPEGEATRVTVNARDAESRALTGLDVQVRLSHPTDQRRDVILKPTETAPGVFEATMPVPHGQWDIVLDLKRKDETVFRSKSRVTI